MENCYALETKPKLSKPQINIRVNGHVINFLIDTGSSINVISKTIYEQKLKDILLHKTSLKALPFTSTTPVPLKDKFQATFETKHQFHVATKYVTADEGGCLLSATTAQELGLVRLNLNTLQLSKMRTKQWTELELIQDPQIKEILRQHKPVFSSMGNLKGKQIKLCIDKDVKPLAQQTRRIPFHIREKVEMELQKLETQDTIEKVPDNENTDWVSPIVVVRKKIIKYASVLI